MGIDPGLNCTGYGVVDRSEKGECRLVEGGAVRTKVSQSLAQRLALIHEGLAAVMEEWGPDLVIVETLYAKYSHPATAILMGHARGVVCLAAQQRGVPVEEYAASEVKRALTGHGRASKEQVAGMVCRLLSLAEAPKPLDVTDALALALCHARPARMGGPRSLPAAVQAALEAAEQERER
jgi:crossover junction endodeoxyribonuclease RuvC